MKRILKIAFLITGVLAVIFIILLIIFNRGMSEVEEMTIDDVDLSRIASGTYEGEFDTGRWANRVEVTVEDNTIKDILIIKDQEVALPDVSPVLIERVLQEQTLGVDMVTDATVSSKAYLKAIRDALLRGYDGDEH